LEIGLHEIIEHLAAIEKEIRLFQLAESTFLRSSVTIKWRPEIKHYAVLQQYNGTGDNGNIYATITSAVPISLRSQAGSIAHNLRTCLDHLACQLAVRNGETNLKGVYFPVAQSKEAFLQNEIKKIEKLSEVDRQKIISLSPYDNGHPLLFKLHMLDINLKHIRLSTCLIKNPTIVLGGGAVSITNSSGVFENVIINGVRLNRVNFSIGEVQLTTPNKECPILENVPRQLEVQAKFELVFSSPDKVSGMPVANSLIDFHQMVRAIVANFE
jgi:hypothetical protein